MLSHESEALRPAYSALSGFSHQSIKASLKEGVGEHVIGGGKARVERFDPIYSIFVRHFYFENSTSKLR